MADVLRASPMIDRLSGYGGCGLIPGSGNTLATGDVNGTIYLWNAGTGTPTAALRDPDGEAVWRV